MAYGRGLWRIAFLLIATCGAIPALGQYSFRTLVQFNGSDGSEPCSGLLLSNGIFYATTFSGGAYGDGCVFSVPISGGTPKVLTSFDGSNGQGPEGNLLLVNGNLIGTTTFGGANADGTVFSLPVSGGTPTTLAAMDGTDGRFVYAGVQLSNGF